MNLRRQAMKASVGKFETNSKCSAFTDNDTNTHTHAFNDHWSESGTKFQWQRSCIVQTDLTEHCIWSNTFLRKLSKQLRLWSHSRVMTYHTGSGYGANDFTSNNDVIQRSRKKSRACVKELQVFRPNEEFGDRMTAVEYHRMLTSI